MRESKTLEEVSKTDSFREVGYSRIRLELDVPVGRISSIANMVSFLRNRFNDVTVRVVIEANDGEISEIDYEDKIKETLIQSDITVEGEERE